MTPTSEADGGATTDEQPPNPPRRRIWPVVVALAVLSSIIGAGSFQVPYYAIAPGSALPVATLVKVVDGPFHKPKGSVYLCTVSLRHATILQALEGWLDPTIDVVKEQVIKPPDVGRQEFRNRNLQEMATSKQKALGVAFEALGYDAITGNGALVVQVVAGSAADNVLEVGDTIVAVDDEPVELQTDAVRLLGAKSPGDSVRLKVQPQGQGAPRDVEVTLGKNPNRPAAPFLGVSLDTRKPSFDFPYEVDIASEQIGGPSAGLAFTLEVLDVLTEGELTGGNKVAATGTIELDGSVGEVGGVAQKTVAVQDAGVGIFLVPRAEVAEARAHAGKGLRVEPVDDLDDALRILSSFGGNGLSLGRPGTVGA